MPAPGGPAATVLDPEPAHTLYELCEFDRRLTEPDHSSDNAAAIALQQHGLIRRRAPGITLVPTNDVRYSLKS